MSRVLLVAPTCDGEDVGEAWVAYQWVRRLSRRHDVTVLTYYKRGKTPPSRQLDGVRVVEWSEPPLLGRAERLNSLMKPAYVPFYLRARRWVRGALARGEQFDLGHQVAPVALRYPSPLVGLGLPYVIGPVGGSLQSPPGFAEEEGTSPRFVALRGLDGVRFRRDPLLRRSFAQADCVLGIAGYVRDVLHDIPLRRFESLGDTGVEELGPVIERVASSDPVRLLFVGRVIRTKGVRDAVRAMGLVRDLPVTLDVVGEGFDRAKCESLTSELGLGDRIRFHGWVDHDLVADFYRDADVFLFPSYREPGGTVTFEAMAAGLPLVVCDRGGPATAVDDMCGFRVPAHNPDQYAHSIADVVRRLVAEPELRLELGRNARKRASEVALWETKIDRVDALYEEILRARA